MTKWKRHLGTSKREQGIVTPKAPQNIKKKKILEPVVAIILPWWKKLWQYIVRKN